MLSPTKVKGETRSQKERHFTPIMDGGSHQTSDTVTKRGPLYENPTSPVTVLVRLNLWSRCVQGVCLSHRCPPTEVWWVSEVRTEV